MQKTTIIFSHGGGRLANQLTNFAHFISFYEEYKNKFDIINIAFAPYAEYFESTKNQGLSLNEENPTPNKKFKVIQKLFLLKSRSSRILRKVLIKGTHLLYGILPGKQSIIVGDYPNHYSMLLGRKFTMFDINNPDMIKILSSHQETIIAGWPIRSWELFEKHKDIVRSKFKFVKEIDNRAESCINEIRTGFDMIVGVFIRQTDYKRWLNGKYYFSGNMYAKWMKEVENLFPDKKIVFLISSDQKQDLSLFTGLNVRFVTGNPFGDDPFIINFAELSKCDYILSPPSTYGAWCSFLNNIPLICVYNSNQSITNMDILENNIFEAFKHPFMSEAIN
ncbi:MAG: glycosyl transferase family 11 [Bacteroidota bacterium]|nr:glycosyl transferase family 11 [Bacteroidota bacterium]